MYMAGIPRDGRRLYRTEHGALRARYRAVYLTSFVLCIIVIILIRRTHDVPNPGDGTEPEELLVDTPGSRWNVTIPDLFFNSTRRELEIPKKDRSRGLSICKNDRVTCLRFRKRPAQSLKIYGKRAAQSPEIPEKERPGNFQKRLPPTLCPRFMLRKK